MLRDHWMAGRLSLEEFEDRCGEAWSARYVADLWGAVRELPAPPSRAAAGRGTRGAAVASVLLATTGLAILLMSFGLLSLLSLPISTSGWMIGRGARRAAADGERSVAGTGEVLGLAGTVLACLALTACAAILG